MKIEKNINPESVNKLFRRARVQKTLLDFVDSNDMVWRLTFDEGEYSRGARGAQGTYHSAIRRLGISVLARYYNDALYLIKLDPDYL